METCDAAQGPRASAHDVCMEDAAHALLSMRSQVVPARDSQAVATSTAQSALSAVTSAPPQGALATLYAGRNMEQEPNKSTPARFETTSGRAQERKRDKLADQSSVFDKSFTERLAKLKSLFCGIHSDSSAPSKPALQTLSSATSVSSAAAPKADSATSTAESQPALQTLSSATSVSSAVASKAGVSTSTAVSEPMPPLPLSASEHLPNIHDKDSWLDQRKTLFEPGDSDPSDLLAMLNSKPEEELKVLYNLIMDSFLRHCKSHYEQHPKFSRASCIVFCLKRFVESFEMKLLKVESLYNRELAEHHENFYNVVAGKHGEPPFSVTSFHATSLAAANEIAAGGFKKRVRSLYGDGHYTAVTGNHALGFSRNEANPCVLVCRATVGPTKTGQRMEVNFGQDEDGRSIMTSMDPNKLYFCCSNPAQLRPMYCFTFEKLNPVAMAPAVVPGQGLPVPPAVVPGQGLLTTAVQGGMHGKSACGICGFPGHNRKTCPHAGLMSSGAAGQSVSTPPATAPAQTLPTPAADVQPTSHKSGGCAGFVVGQSIMVVKQARSYKSLNGEKGTIVDILTRENTKRLIVCLWNQSLEAFILSQQTKGGIYSGGTGFLSIPFAHAVPIADWPLSSHSSRALSKAQERLQWKPGDVWPPSSRADGCLAEYCDVVFRIDRKPEAPLKCDFPHGGEVTSHPLSMRDLESDRYRYFRGGHSVVVECTSFRLRDLIHGKKATVGWFHRHLTSSYYSWVLLFWDQAVHRQLQDSDFLTRGSHNTDTCTLTQISEWPSANDNPAALKRAKEFVKWKEGETWPPFSSPVTASGLASGNAPKACSVYKDIDLDKLKVDELQGLLKAKGLSSAGKKAELIQRLLATAASGLSCTSTSAAQAASTSASASQTSTTSTSTSQNTSSCLGKRPRTPAESP